MGVGEGLVIKKYSLQKVPRGRYVLEKTDRR